MQSKIFSAAIAALALTSVDAAAVAKRQASNAIIILPGSIVGPTIIFDPSAFGFEALAWRALDQLRDDLSRTAALVVELNKATSANIEDKRAQASAVVAQIQANANAIKTKIDTLIPALQGKVPALPTIGALPTLPTGAGGLPALPTGAGGLPALPTGAGGLPAIPTGAGGLPAIPTGAGGLPAIPTGAGGAGGSGAAATQTVIGTVGGIVDRVEAVVTQARTLNTQARTQLSLVGSFLETLLTPILGQIKNDSSRNIALAMQQISTASEQLISTIGGGSTNAQGATPSFLQRITDARISLRPILILGISPEITV